MCLFVCLGVDQQLSQYSDPPVGDVGLNPWPNSRPHSRPNVLSGKRLVYRVAGRADSGWSCSCIFLDDADPAEYDDIAAREKAYASLARIAHASLKVDAQPLMFSYWDDGDVIPQPLITRDLPPEELRFGRRIFTESSNGNDGVIPPTLIKIIDATAEEIQ